MKAHALMGWWLAAAAVATPAAATAGDPDRALSHLAKPDAQKEPPEPTLEDDRAADARARQPDAAAETGPKAETGAKAETGPNAETGANASPGTAAERDGQAERLERRYAQDEQSQAEREPLDFGRAVLQMIVVLGLICLLAYIFLGKLLPKMMRVDVPATGGRRVLRLVDRLAIDPKRSLMVVKIGDEHFFVGATEQQIGLIARLDPEQIEAALIDSDPGPGTNPMERLGRLFRRGPEETI